MRAYVTNPVLQRSANDRRAREAALLVLCDERAADFDYIRELSEDGWHRLLRWLDTSGIALYFLDRVVELEQISILPAKVLQALHRRLADNTARTESMIAEAAELHSGFQRAGVRYATLKGFSLFPDSVPKLELRSQLDLDFLVAEETAIEARRVLEANGYCLSAISGRSWEFKTREEPGISLDRLYKAGVCRSAELHIEDRDGREASPLSRVHRVCFRGMLMPVLSPVDLFLGQGLHLFKHVCSEFSRVAHWLEFRRHVIARSPDVAFWHKVRSQAEAMPRAAAALGIVTLLIAQATGDFAPEALTSWTVDRLPAGARRWVDNYGKRAAFMSFPGSKIYLLLQKELASTGIGSGRPLWRAILPTRLPPRVVGVPDQETLLSWLRRNQLQARFVLLRLRFHVVQGFIYLFESVRWRLYSAGAVQ